MAIDASSGRVHGSQDGLQVGAATRLAAELAGRPVAYQVVLELGWRWAAGPTSTAHLVPPDGDRTSCGLLVPRHRRRPIDQPTRATTCGKCRASVGLPT